MFPNSSHVELLGMRGCTDTEIWNLAEQNGYCWYPRMMIFGKGALFVGHHRIGKVTFSTIFLKSSLNHMITDIYIGAARRTPLGSFLGSLSSLSATDLGAAAIQAAIADSGIDPAAIDEVLMGCILPAGLGQ